MKDVDLLEWVKRRAMKMMRASLLQTQAERVRVVQPAKEKDLGRPYRTFHCLKGAYKKMEGELFTRADSDRIRRSGFKF